MASDITSTVPIQPQFLSADVQALLADCDVILGNLECTLPGNGETVPTEPRVVSTPVPQ